MMISRQSCLGLGVALIVLVSTCTTVTGQPCYCRTSTGERVEVGDVACLESLEENGSPQQAQCVLVLNNTAWNFTGKPCPLARHDGRQDGMIAEYRLE